MAWIGRLRVAAASAAQKVKPFHRLVRGYGATTAVELDYDYDCHEDEQLHQDRHQACPKIKTTGSTPGRGLQWVLMGEPVLKRHMYAERFSKLLEVPHISMGRLFDRSFTLAPLFISKKLVPEDVIFALLSKRLEEGYYRGEIGFILDGIPRTKIQAEILDQIVDVDLLVNFKCHELLKKKSEIEKLSSCQESFTVGEAKNVARTWKENWYAYSKQGKLVEDYYKKQKKLLDFHMTGAAGDSLQGLLAALDLQHMHAISSSSKLTA